MARKFDIQLKNWFPLIISSYYTYETLNTLEIVKQSGRPLVILGAREQIQEILRVLDFLVIAKFIIPKDKQMVTYFGVNFNSFTYDVTDNFKKIIEESTDKNNYHASDWIKQIKVEDTTHNIVNLYNFNFTFALDKLIEFKAGLLNF